jgi:hypothetical protein
MTTNYKGFTVQHNNLRLRNVVCRHILPNGEQCNTVVGISNGNQLFFDGEPVKENPFFIGFTCKKCGQPVKWRQTIKTIADGD